jgi:hypothetical protein
LEPTSAGDEVAKQLRAYLDAIRHQPHVSPAIYDFSLHVDKVSRSYWPGLFHCYELPGLPRTNNEIESHFRDTGRQLLRITGQKGLTGRTLQRQGAWELLPRPATEAKLLDGLSQIPPKELSQERQRFATQLLPKIQGFLFLNNGCNMMYQKALFHFD